METYYPMIVEEYIARRDSCGAGQFRGGCGIKKVYRFLSDGRITYQDDRAATYPYGVAGGKPGTPSKKTLIRKSGEEIELPSKVRDVPVFELLEAARLAEIPVAFTTVAYRESDKLTAAAFIDKVPALLTLEART